MNYVANFTFSAILVVGIVFGYWLAEQTKGKSLATGEPIPAPQFRTIEVVKVEATPAKVDAVPAPAPKMQLVAAKPTVKAKRRLAKARKRRPTAIHAAIGLPTPAAPAPAPAPETFIEKPVPEEPVPGLLPAPVDEPMKIGQSGPAYTEDDDSAGHWGVEETREGNRGSKKLFEQKHVDMQTE